MKELLCVYTDRRLILFSLLDLIQQGVQMATAISFTTQILGKRKIIQYFGSEESRCQNHKSLK